MPNKLTPQQQNNFDKIRNTLTAADATAYRNHILEGENRRAEAILDKATKAQPKADAPKAEPPKAEAPKAEAPKAQAPKTGEATPGEPLYPPKDKGLEIVEGAGPVKPPTFGEGIANQAPASNMAPDKLPEHMANKEGLSPEEQVEYGNILYSQGGPAAKAFADKLKALPPDKRPSHMKAKEGMTPEEQVEYGNILYSQGGPAAKAFADKLKALPPDKRPSHMKAKEGMTPEQQVEYGNILYSQGGPAADAYAQSIKGGAPSSGGSFGSAVASELPPSQPTITTPGVNPGVNDLPPWTDPSKDVDYSNPASVAGAISNDLNLNFNKNLLANRPNQETPYGSVTYETDPVTGQLRRTEKLSAGQQGLLDAETEAETFGAQAAKGLLGGIPTTYDPNSLNDKYAIPTGDEAQRTRIEEATYQRLTRDLDRQQAKALEDKKQELANRGIPLGSKLYSDQIREVQDQYDRARSSARLDATQLGGQELERTYGMGLQSRQQAISDLQSQFNLPASVAASLVGMGQGPRGAEAIPFTTVESPYMPYGDIASLQQGYDQMDQQQDQFLESLGLDQAKLDFAKRQWRAERAKRKAEVAAINRSNRGGGGGGGGSAPPDTDPAILF